MTRFSKQLSILAVPVALAACTELSSDPVPEAPARLLLWGDTHLHTSNSSDAFATGNRELGPEAALRFAKGETVISSTGQSVQLDRPLDFLMVSDHAEGLGLSRAILDGHPDLIADPQVAKWRDMMLAGPKQSGEATRQMIAAFGAGKMPEVMRDPKILDPLTRQVWRKHVLTIEEFNDPGKFVAFAGYEYSSLPNGNNQHRNVIFRDGPDRTLQVLPFSSYQSQDPADLWRALANYEAKTGGSAFSIPHNSNLSNGVMFAPNTFTGNPLDTETAALRARWEPLVEITQIKGDSESHPHLSPDDDMADYGDAGWDLGNLVLSEGKTAEMFKGDYVREALKTGLSTKDNIGVNPFQLGFIGSTDSHTALSTADSDLYFSKHANAEPRPGRLTIPASPNRPSIGQRYGWQYLASGYAAVWAESHTRTGIFDAMKRRETYATTGPRIKLRSFVGDLANISPDHEDWISVGYAKGVPMGGKISLNKAPTVIAEATRDPNGAGLDRLQIIKGWVTPEGSTDERVFDVAASGGRMPNRDWRINPLPSSVDVKTATYDVNQGTDRLIVSWTDPTYNQGETAFYYIRVIEVATPRWSTYDAVEFDVPLPEGTPIDVRERAYGSPVWVRSADF